MLIDIKNNDINYTTTKSNGQDRERSKREDHTIFHTCSKCLFKEPILLKNAYNYECMKCKMDAVL